MHHADEERRHLTFLNIYIYKSPDGWGTRFNENPPISTLTPSHTITAAAAPATTTPTPTLPTSWKFRPSWYSTQSLSCVTRRLQGHLQEEQIAPNRFNRFSLQRKGLSSCLTSIRPLSTLAGCYPDTTSNVLACH